MAVYHHPMPSLPAAVLFDLDGTLVDTEPFWLAAETALAAQHGVTWTTQDGLGQVGRSMASTGEELARRGVRLSVEQIVDALVARVGAAVRSDVPWQSGAWELLAALAELGVPLALVTSSPRVLAEPVVAAAALRFGAPVFGAVVAGDDGVVAKPDPDPYLRAAGLLGVEVRACVALEDSPSGIASAMAAGAQVVAVRSVLPVSPWPGLAIVDTLVGVGPADLLQVTAAARARAQVTGSRPR